MVTRRSAIHGIGALAAALALPPWPLSARGAGKPPRLRIADTVGLIEPAGFSDGPANVEAVLHTIRGMGLVPKVGRHVAARHGYLAGTDEQRASDLNAMYADPEVQRGHVAEADQQLRVRPDRPPVEQRQDARAAPAAAHREHRAHLGIGIHRVEVARALLVGPGQVAVPRGDVAAELRHQPHAADRVRHRFDIRRPVAESGGLDQPDRVADPQPRGRG